MSNEPESGEPRVCVVTGGSSGVGLATAQRFLKAGCCVVICGRDSARLQAAEALLAAEGGDNVASINLDVGESDAGERLIEFSVRRFGRVDVLVNNAGTAPLAPAHAMSSEEFDRCLSTNIRGVFATTQAAWPGMCRQGGGAIINVSSLSAVDPFPGLGVYGASKAWVELFTKATAEEGREHHIHVMAVAPGAVDTPMLHGLFPDIPHDVRLASDEVAELIYRLSTKAMANCTGQTISIRR